LEVNLLPLLKSRHSILSVTCLGSLLAVASNRADADLFTVNFEGIISTTGSFLDPTGNFSQGDAMSGF
jgi:hypothetical protein